MRSTTFSERLKTRMNELNITAAELSRRMGLNEAIISQYRSGKYEPKQNRLEEFAKVLGVNESWLMGYETDKSPTAGKDDDSSSYTPEPTDEEKLKVALFGGDGEVTDEMWNEVKQFAKFVKQQKGSK